MVGVHPSLPGRGWASLCACLIMSGVYLQDYKSYWYFVYRYMVTWKSAGLKESNSDSAHYKIISTSTISVTIMFVQEHILHTTRDTWLKLWYMDTGDKNQKSHIADYGIVSPFIISVYMYIVTKGYN